MHWLKKRSRRVLEQTCNVDFKSFCLTVCLPRGLGVIWINVYKHLALYHCTGVKWWLGSPSLFQLYSKLPPYSPLGRYYIQPQWRKMGACSAQGPSLPLAEVLQLSTSQRMFWTRERWKYQRLCDSLSAIDSSISWWLQCSKAQLPPAILCSLKPQTCFD